MAYLYVSVIFLSRTYKFLNISRITEMNTLKRVELNFIVVLRMN